MERRPTDSSYPSFFFSEASHAPPPERPIFRAPLSLISPPRHQDDVICLPAGRDCAKWPPISPYTPRIDTALSPRPGTCVRSPIKEGNGDRAFFAVPRVGAPCTAQQACAPSQTPNYSPACLEHGAHVRNGHRWTPKTTQRGGG